MSSFEGLPPVQLSPSSGSSSSEVAPPIGLSSPPSRISSATTLCSATDKIEKDDQLPGDARPGTHARTTSKEYQAELRRMTKEWLGSPITSRGSEAIMYPSWTNFGKSCVNKTTSDDFKACVNKMTSDDFKASVLCTARVTTRDFNPTLMERTYLGFDQPKAVPKPQARPMPVVRRADPPVEPSSNNSWSTVASSEDSQSQSTEFTFGRCQIKKTATTSLLTQSIRSPVELPKKTISPLGFFAKAHAEAKANGGKSVLSASMLPSAFDSDSEDEESEEATQKPVNTNGRKPVLSASMLPSAFDSDSEDEEPEA